MKAVWKVITVVGTTIATLITITATVIVVPQFVALTTAAAATETTTCLAAPASPQRADPVIEVLNGVTPSDESSSLASTRSAALSKIVAAGFNMKARLLVEAIGSGAAQDNLAVNTQLQASGPNQLFLQQNQHCKQRGVTKAVRQLQSSKVPGDVDVLSALQVAQNNLTGLTGTKTPIDVVLMSSMLSANAPLQLTTPNVLATDPSTLIAQVRSAGLLPDCRGWNVYIVGGGTTATGGLSDVPAEQLHNFWSSFFSACGGQLVDYVTQLAQFPVAPVKHAATHVKIKHVTNAVTRQQNVVMTIPNDVLFPSGSAVLSAYAGATLTQLLPILLQQYPDGSIQVTGYTDNVPIDLPGGNVQLSIERAQAAITWFAQHGVASNRMHAFGVGSGNPIASNATTAGQAANRRVVVAVST